MISKNLTKYIRSLEQKKHRKCEGLFVAEGPKVVGELLKRYTPHTIVATEEYFSIENVDKYPHCNVIVASDEELRKVSFLQHPQQIVALFPMPAEDTVPTADYWTTTAPDRLILALDGIQDPGNLGTIIRIADWFGIDDVVCSLDTADAYNPKVVQATMGSLARVNISYIDLDLFLTSLPPQIPVYGTLLDGDDIYGKQLSKSGVIVMGNEGKGISESVRKRLTDRLLIPNCRKGDGAESLNVSIATAIICAEFRRRT